MSYAGVATGTNNPVAPSGSLSHLLLLLLLHCFRRGCCGAGFPYPSLDSVSSLRVLISTGRLGFSERIRSLSLGVSGAVDSSSSWKYRFIVLLLLLFKNIRLNCYYIWGLCFFGRSESWSQHLMVLVSEVVPRMFDAGV